ncbi:MAG: hypothetical protein ACRD0K_11315, partial [Egibacteraceae bacterium]
MASQRTQAKRAKPRGPVAKRRSSPTPRKAPTKKPRQKAQAKAPAQQKPPRQPLPPDRLRDIWGVGLLVLALLSGLGTYAQGSAGLAGEFLVGLYRGLFGVFGLAVPLWLAGGGVLLLRQPRPANRWVVSGAVLGLLAIMGLWHLAAPEPLGLD